MSRPFGPAEFDSYPPGNSLGQGNSLLPDTQPRKPNVVAIACFFVAPMALLLPWTVQIPSLLNAVLAYAGLLLACIALVIATSDYFRPMLALPSAFTMCWLSIPAIYQLAHGAAAWNDAAVVKSGTNVTAALALNLVAQAAILLGYSWWRIRRRSGLPPVSSTAHGTPVNVRQPDAPETRDDRPAGRNVLTVGLGLVGLSAVMLPYVAGMRGGIGVMLLPRDLQDLYVDPSLDLAVAGGIQATIVQFFPPTFAVSGSLLLIAAMRTRGRASAASVLGFVLGISMTWLYANPIANTRFLALAMLGSIALALFHPRSRWLGNILIAVFVFVLLLIYPLSAVFTKSTGLSESAVLEQGIFTALAGPDFDGFQQIINSFEFVEDHGHSWGLYVVSALLVFIPRSIWQAKATPASLDVAANHGYTFINLSLPTNAEIFIDFGWLGVAIMFVLVGAAFAWLDAKWVRGTPVMQSLVAFCSLAAVGLMRGPLGSQMPVVIFVIMIMSVMSIVTRHSQAAEVQAPDPGSDTQR